MQIYDKLPSAAQKLVRIPRYARLIATLPEERFGRLENGASTYWELYTYVSEFSIDDSGVLDCGLRADGARLLGWHEKDEPRPDDRDHQFRTRQVALAMTMLSAMAFEMMFESPDSDSKSSQDSELYVAVPTAKKEDGVWLSFRDEIAGSKEVDTFTNKVQNRLTASNAYFLGNPAHQIDASRFIVDWRRLKALNAKGLEFLTLSAYDTTIRFRDISLQAFLAAYWLCNFATASDRLRVLKTLPHWERSKQWSETTFYFVDRNAMFVEFWNFLIDMPTLWMTADQRDRWEAMIGLIYKHPDENWNKGTMRPTELIYRSWKGMEGSEARKIYEREFESLLQTKNKVAMGILLDAENESHFLSLCERERSQGDPESLQDNGMLGDRPIPHFRLHRYCTTNAEYELFDSRHIRFREFEYRVSDVSCHPVVNVSWYDAWCFSKWLGKQKFEDRDYEIDLPANDQWEYACRCKEITPYTWHDRQNGDLIDPGYCNFNGNPWPNAFSDRSFSPIYIGRTIPVDGKDAELKALPNPWGFYQMHGNVHELCSIIGEEDHLAGLHGGSWHDRGSISRADYCPRCLKSQRTSSFGFRLAAVPIRPSSISEAVLSLI